MGNLGNIKLVQKLVESQKQKDRKLSQEIIKNTAKY
tara:strand:- start:520 stop:627 length:108 start_codon:yes stop_codon:yes gene_type:complete